MIAVRTKSLTIGSNLAELDALGRFTDELASEAGLSPSRAYHLRLAADELATNVIVHGYGPGRPGQLLIEGGTCDGSVWIRLTDGAGRFDPHNDGPAVDVTEPLAARRPGGLGLHLVRSIANVFHWEHVRGQNQQTLVIHQDPPGSPGRPDAGSSP